MANHPEKNKSPKRQNFLQGAAILTVGAILVKLIGALYKIPLNRMITTEGFGHFNVAYSIYNVLLTISSAGLPVAVARMISEADTLGQRRQVQQIFRVSTRIFLTLGILSSALMFFFARQLSFWMEDPDAIWAVKTLAPAVLFVCIICAFRGYAQGHRYMTSTAVSQVIEALSKLIIGLGAVVLILRAGLGYAEAAGGAISGITSGSILAALYLAVDYRRRRVPLTPEDMAGPVKSGKETAVQLIKLAVPITIGATGLQIFNAIDTKIILGQLQHALGMSSRGASSVFGTYSAAQTIYMLPSSLIAPLAVSVIPSVTAALTMQNHLEARRTTESCIRMTAMISLPFAAGMAVLSEPIQKLLYGYGPHDLSVAGPVLAILAIAVFFNCMVSVTNAILQAYGKVTYPVYTSLIGGVVNILTDYFLIANPDIGINGAAVATIAYCAVITLLNIFIMHRIIDLPPRFLRQCAKPLCATAIMALVTYLSYRGVFAVLHRGSLACLASILVSIIAYAALVAALKIITWEDCRLLPKGDLIARLLHIKPPAEENGGTEG